MWLSFRKHQGCLVKMKACCVTSSPHLVWDYIAGTLKPCASILFRFSLDLLQRAKPKCQFLTSSAWERVLCTAVVNGWKAEECTRHTLDYYNEYFSRDGYVWWGMKICVWHVMWVFMEWPVYTVCVNDGGRVWALHWDEMTTGGKHRHKRGRRKRGRGGERERWHNRWYILPGGSRGHGEGGSAIRQHTQEEGGQNISSAHQN